MYYNKENKQWIYGERDKAFSSNSNNLRDYLISKGICILAPGTVMVFLSTERKPLMMFQTLEAIDLLKVNNSTLIGIEQGSLLYFTSIKPKSPATTFKHCRLPTEYEFKLYERTNLV